MIMIAPRFGLVFSQFALSRRRRKGNRVREASSSRMLPTRARSKLLYCFVFFCAEIGIVTDIVGTVEAWGTVFWHIIGWV